MEPITVLILAGGRSARMGRDKAWLQIDGQPLIERVARRLLPLAGEIVFSANDPAPFAELITRLPVAARVVPDVFSDAGPLAGLHAGLGAARFDTLLAVATDMPFVNHAVVEQMVGLCEEADAVVPRLAAEGFDAPQPEPLHAVYRRTCIPAIEAALLANRRRVVSFLPDVNVCYVDEAALRTLDPELSSFRNVNTPEEWRAIERRSGE
ncbi:MAG: molybdenum cofactor guanylyltransferase [Anaerolineae bacterium]|jgi:molybdopterin-guanine dinucleotide biosynthesis protein A|nr:molybdenum cofactor guanylyltransferase [Anaerolineae bacterium]